MKLIIIPLIVYFLNQIIKLSIHAFKNGATLGNSFIWRSFWMGGFPSAHTAVLTSCLYLIYIGHGIDVIFTFALFVSLIIVYGLLEDKKRQRIFEHYFSQSEDLALRKIIPDKILMEFSGHDLADILFGILEGLVFTYLLTSYLINL